MLPHPDKAARLAAKKARKLARRAARKKFADYNPADAQPVLAAARSVAHRPLPPPPPGLAPDAVTILLCYQYVEPAWTRRQHKAAITRVNALAEKHNVTGRGRCAPEGLNMTLSASAENMRAFCMALRKWKPELFNQTDFKLSDGEIPSALFRTFTLRKVRLFLLLGICVCI